MLSVFKNISKKPAPNLYSSLIRKKSNNELLNKQQQQHFIYNNSLPLLSKTVINQNKNVHNNNNNNNNNGHCSSLIMNNGGQRNFGSWGFRFLMGFSIVGIMYFARRWQPRQIQRIIQMFKNGSDDMDILSLTAKDQTFHSNVSFNREKEVNYLNSFLLSPPLGPIVIVGPEGCGKSHIVRRVLSSRQMSILVDMRKNAVMTGDELLLSFLGRLGYLLPSSDPISSLFLKAEKKQKLNVQEIVQGLDTIFQALIKIKETFNITPLITISNIEALPTSENFTRFLDWCLSVTDNKLANIVFLTSSQFVHFDLDANTNFKKRRFVYNINFPTNSEVRKYLHLVFNDENSHTRMADYSNNVTTGSNKDNQQQADIKLDNEGTTCKDKTTTTTTTTGVVSGNNGNLIDNISSNSTVSGGNSGNVGGNNCLTAEEIESMISIFGGQMRDIDLISGLVKRGENFHYLVDLFISESVQKIGSLADSMYQKANASDSDSEKTQIFEKYQRFWKMLEILSTQHVVRVSDLIQNVFDEQPEELDSYFHDNIIYFLVGTIIEQRAISNNSNGSLSNVVSTPQFHSEEEEKDNKKSTATTTTTTTTTSLQFDDQNTITLNDSVVKIGDGVTIIKDISPITSIVNQIPNSTFYNLVSFSSPRIQYAVQVIFKDVRLKLQREAIEKYFKKKDLKDDIKDLEHDKSLVTLEYDKITTRLDSLVANSKEWVKFVGDDDFSKRKDYLIKKEIDLLEKIDSYNDKLFKLELELDNL